MFKVREKSPWGKVSKSDAKKIKKIATSGLVKGKAKVFKIK